MKKSIVKLFAIMMLGFPLLLLSACGDGGGASTSSNSSGTISVGITDDSGLYNAVVLTILDVGAVVSGDETVYYNSSTIDVLPTKVDVLAFANENYFQLSDIEVPLPEGGGEVCFNQIRLVLAAEGDTVCKGRFCNYVITADDTFELKTPSGQQSGVKIKAPTDFCVSEGQSTVQVLIDFDPAKAIVHQQKNKNDPFDDEFILKPTSLRIIQGAWSATPESFMEGLVIIPTYDNGTACETLPIGDSDWAVVAAEQGGEVVVQTGALLEGPVYNSAVCEEWCFDLAGPTYNSCRLDCGDELDSTCYYSGKYKLVLPDLGLYDVSASWEGLSATEVDVSYNTALLMELLE